jgi:hypothetical protein
MLGRASVGYECMKKVMKDAADLIKRQQAEIEVLKKGGNKIDSLGLVATLMDQKERLVRAKNEWEREVRSEAVREFAERLKETNLYEFIEEYFDNAELCYEVRSDLFNDFVDNLVKEMTDKEGGKG